MKIFFDDKNQKVIYLSVSIWLLNVSYILTQDQKHIQDKFCLDLLMFDKMVGSHSILNDFMKIKMNEKKIDYRIFLDALFSPKAEILGKKRIDTPHGLTILESKKER